MYMYVETLIHICKQDRFKSVSASVYSGQSFCCSHTVWMTGNSAGSSAAARMSRLI